MANFAPSIYFAKRWLATPSNVKRAFYEELDDIIFMLQSNESVEKSQFTHENFDDAVASLLISEQSNHQPKNKLVHSLDTTSLASRASSIELSGNDIEILQQQIEEKLSAQMNDFLDEHFTQLSQDLYTWLQTAIKNELATYKRPIETTQNNTNQNN